MKLLLDEHYSPEIAVQLASTGHDVEAVKGDVSLEGLNDERLIQAAAERGRALLTNNVGDFMPLARAWAARGEEHLGLVFTSDESMPRSRNTIGLYVGRLTELMEANQGEAALRGRVEWLTP